MDKAIFAACAATAAGRQRQKIAIDAAIRRIKWTPFKWTPCEDRPSSYLPLQSGSDCDSTVRSRRYRALGRFSALVHIQGVLRGRTPGFSLTEHT